ncbi:MAG: glycosyltransferase [Acidobacteriota bacterium]|nr:glycosyltransferase [Acidobacteriota bacterium]
MTVLHPFRKTLIDDYAAFLEEQSLRFPAEDTVRIDLHCHDKNSDIPDELWGRILRLPETWLDTRDLLRRLREQGADAFTVTNHNNARSCWEMLDKGHDILPGAEFTCHFPEFDVSVHVLTYGFTQEQEEHLNVKRRNIYKFLEYCKEHDLPTVLPHPLYFYSPSFRPSPSLFEKFALLFERFEVLNGQRDLWQNLMTVDWLDKLTPEKLEAFGKRHGIKPGVFTQDPYKKRITGGSDDHMGIFAGSCGTLMHIPNLKARRKQSSMADLALEALRTGELAPYGVLGEEEKLQLGLLGYFCQVALNMEDPGLIRMFLHRGSLRDKLMCLAVGNGMMELKRHKTTMRFFRTFHDALTGRRPGRLTGLLVSRDFKPMLSQVDRMARGNKMEPEAYLDVIRDSLPALFTEMNRLLVRRISTKINKLGTHAQIDPGEMVRKMEIPSHLRALFGADAPRERRDMARVNLSELFDNLSFPLLASGVLAGSALTSSKVLYQNRAFLDDFAAELGNYQHPKRVLWLTDTLNDRNGVSTVLCDVLEEVRKRDLPIDFLVCDETSEPGDHLRVVRPVTTFKMPWYPGQEFRVPDLLEIQRLFREGAYDRILCSTELLMGPAALYLKTAFRVPAYFYMHTDWLDFFEKNSALDTRAIDRVRRILRAFYRQFQGVFVLNSQHRDWLTSPAIGMPRDRVYTTAHWAAPHFQPAPQPREMVLPGIDEDDPVLLFAGRISGEKGVGDLPGVLERIRRQIPNAQMVFAGTGPAEADLKEKMPDAHFPGWIDSERLVEIYSNADILLLPSRFDTFGCVVLEAMSCGCPVAAYNCKGPADIITHGQDGYLPETAEQLADCVVDLLSDKDRRREMKQAALMRAAHYQPEAILGDLCRDLGLTASERMELKMRLETDFRTDETTEEPGFLAEILEMANVAE